MGEKHITHLNPAAASASDTNAIGMSPAYFRTAVLGEAVVGERVGQSNVSPVKR
jgi:hypothetical protein